jgi:AhpD family alkylhydroperoxidase
MQRFTIPTRDDVEPSAREIFDDLNAKLGTVPTLYAYIGHSSNALRSYLAFQGAQAQGSFNAREREAVFLAVSEVNGCDYCRAAHTAVGKMNGFSDEETRQLRAGTHPDRKLGTITRLAREITTQRGRVDPGLVDEFFGLGYGQTALVDLVTLVADKTLANYLHNVTGIAIDFPAAGPVEPAAAA